MEIERDEVQTLIFTGLGSLVASCFVLLEIHEETLARSGLGRICDLVSFGKPTCRLTRSVQLALTRSGMDKLGLSAEDLDKLPWSFSEPMEGAHKRRVLGDDGENSPEHWKWSADRCDLLLMLYANDTADLEQLLNEILEQLGDGYSVCFRISGTTLADNKEHFGFKDGLAQPSYKGVHRLNHEMDGIAPGELLCGYPDEHGEVASLPTSGQFDLLRNGTFLVFRQLEQNVAAFWDYLKKSAGSEEDAKRLAAKMMGRWPDGKPIGNSQSDKNASGASVPSFKDDPRGTGCPLGAHIRRSNPRDRLSSDPDQSLKMMKRHRILRRGRPYGNPAPADSFPQGVSVQAATGAEPLSEAERGLLFICLGGDLTRQFEMIQQTWLNNPKNDGVHDEVCPIAAGHQIHADSRRFTVPESPLRQRYSDLPFFVRTRGSGYFLMPGKTALRALSASNCAL